MNKRCKKCRNIMVKTIGTNGRVIYRCTFCNHVVIKNKNSC